MFSYAWILAFAVAILAAVGLTIYGLILLVPLVYLAFWRIVLSEAFNRLTPLRRT